MRNRGEKKDLGIAQIQYVSANSALKIMELCDWGGYDDLLEGLAKHCSADLLDCMVSSPLLDVRRAAATNPRLSPEQIKHLLSDSDSSVAERQSRVTHRLQTHSRRLLHEFQPEVREWLAYNPVLSGQLRNKLVSDEAEQVRVAAARRTDLSPEQQLKLFGDSATHKLSPLTKAHLRGFGSILERSADDYAPVAALTNPNVPVWALEKNIKKGSQDIDLAIAKNPVSLTKCFAHYPIGKIPTFSLKCRKPACPTTC